MNILFQDDSEEYINIEVSYYTHNINGRETLMVFHEKENAPEEIRDDLKTMKGKFKVPDFHTHTDIVKKSIVYRDDGISYHSIVNYKENCMRLLLKEVSTEDKTVAINEENYGRLNPTIADHLYVAFSEQYLNPVIDFEEIKKNKKK